MFKKMCCYPQPIILSWKKKSKTLRWAQMAKSNFSQQPEHSGEGHIFGSTGSQNILNQCDAVLNYMFARAHG